MQIAPYLNFNGQCAEAFKLYERVLGGKIVMMQTHGETPAKDFVPANWHDKVMHVRLEAGSMALMGSDAPPDRYTRPQGIFVSVSVKGVPDASRMFKELSDKGTITMPFEQTFWSPGFGMLVDRYGIPWMINCEPA
jgi:PhnB protein